MRARSGSTHSASERQARQLSAQADTQRVHSQTEDPASPRTSGGHEAGWQMVSDQSIFAATASRLAPEGHPFAADMPPPEDRSPLQSARLLPAASRLALLLLRAFLCQCTQRPRNAAPCWSG